MSDHDHYEVGYGKPPTNTRFRKGQSGNRTGRPKGVKNFKTELSEELEEKITVKEGGRTKRITKKRAIAKTLVTKTLTGDSRWATTLINLLPRIFDLGASEDVTNEALWADEIEILDALAERQSRNPPTDATAEGEPDDGAKL